MIRVLVVEDSVTQREILCRIVRDDVELTVAGEARNGTEAIEMVRELSPDVVLMDVHMGEMNGIEATRTIMRDHPTPVVIMSSTLQQRDIDLAVEAMRVGAVMAIEKPKGAALLHMRKMAPELYRVLRAAAGTRVRTTAVRNAERPKVVAGKYQLPPGSIKVIGVASSAGGPSILVEIFSALPRDYPIPILLVQHISPGFEEGFANWLSQQTGQVAKIATKSHKLEPGIWLAPTGHHIVLNSPHQIGLLPRQSKDIHCPAGDPLLASIADQLGTSAVGVVLTGMGDDGARGLLALKEAGGQTIIQDEATSMVWGMPQAAKKAGASQFELNPAEIADALCRIAKK
jgi:two-component system chemotaxis response regulator CheB